MPKFPVAAGRTERFSWPLPNHRLGGLNLRDDPVSVPPHQFTKLINVLTREGAPLPAPGYALAWNRAPNLGRLCGMAHLAKSDDSESWLVFQKGVSGYPGTIALRLAGATKSVDATVLSQVWPHQPRRVRSRQYGDTLYMVAGYGSGGVQTYDGSAFAAISPDPAADNDVGQSYFNSVQYVAASFERMFYAGSREYPQYVWISELGQPNYCKAGLVVKIDSQDGQDITGLVEYGRYVLVPKERSIWAIPAMDSSATTFSVIRVSAGVGCPSGDTMKTVDNIALFLGHDKRVYYVALGRIADDLRVYPISDLIQQELDALTQEQIYSAEAVVFDGYYILVAGGKWFVLDLQTSQLTNDGANWAIINHAYPNALTTMTLPWVHPTRRELFATNVDDTLNVHWYVSLDGGRYKYNLGYMKWIWETGWMHSGVPERMNTFTQLYANMRPTATGSPAVLEMETDKLGPTAWTLNSQGTGMLLDGSARLNSSTAVLGFKEATVQFSKVPPSQGRRWRFRAYYTSGISAMSGLGYDERPKIERVAVYYQPLRVF